MTEGFIVFVTSLVALVLVDPFYGGGMTKAGLAKIIVLIFAFSALLFHCFGRAVVSPQRFSAACREMLADWWPLLLLGSFVTGGSIYARAVDDIRESFLNVGLGMLFLPLLAVAVRSAEKPMLFMKWLAAVFILTALGSYPILALGLHDFHESIFIIVPLGVYLICGRSFSPWRSVIGLALIGGCVLSVKNTTFVLVLVTLLYCLALWAVRFFRYGNPLAHAMGVLASAPLLLAGAGALGYAWWKHREVLPSGNVEYRAEMYAIAWRTFRDSPIWGTAFTDPSVVFFTLFRVASSTQFLPTHSDLLDLLAHGGLIAAVLWLLVMWRVQVIGWSATLTLVRRPEDVDLRPYQWLAVLFLVQVGGLITCAINPVWISPVYAFWYWGSGGVMWALYKETTGPKLPVKQTHQAMLRKVLAVSP
jgi:hypothetical protein